MQRDAAIASPTGRRLQLGPSMNDYAKLPPRLTRIFANNPVFFVTFCTHRRRKLLATKSVNAAFVEFGIRAHAEQNVAVGRYVIMPDHLHLFVCGADDFQLGGWIGMLKQHLGKVMGKQKQLGRSGNGAFSTICCAARRGMDKSGITSARTLSAQD